MLSLDHLNPAQREAVLHGDGPLVVFAGAGSGKTRVITHRIAHLVLDRGIDPASILAVTFTNKAAGEMRERLGPLLGGSSRRILVGTFHAMSARLLRELAPRLGLRRDFVVYDDQDQLAMLKRIVRDLQLDEDAVPPKKLAHRIDAAKNDLLGPDDVGGWDTLSRELPRVYAEYERRMRAASALDFGDLIVRLTRALESDVALRDELTDRIRYLLVDEFQDTNHAQLRLVRALANQRRNVTVVGDDDQSIYRWRGADRRNILHFRQHFGDATVVKLEQNYRSSARILAAAYEVIRRAEEREEKHLFTQNAEGDPVLVVRAASERDEAEMVARGAAQLASEGVPLSEVAVFYRTHAQSRVLEEHLMARAIPYRVVGGMRFFERAEVKDVLAYLRLVSNPADDVSFYRVVNVPARGLGKTTIEKVGAHAHARGTNALEAMRALVDEGALPKAAASKARAFVELVDALGALRAEGSEASVLAREVLERSGYRAMLTADDSAEADARLQNLGELVAAMAEYESEDESPSLEGFLERVTLDVGTEADGSGEKVTLMTVHAAKGLEFEVVMVTGLEEELFPSRARDGDDREALDEERRLAYVAFTRARRRLVLSHADERRLYGVPRHAPRSRFLEELRGKVQEIDARPPSLRSSYDGGGYRGGYSSGYGSRGSFGSGRPSREGQGWDADEAPPRPARSSSGEGRGGSYVDRDDGDLGVDSFRPGARVSHPKFGVGVVRRVERGLPPKATVAFADVGEKTVVVSFLELLR